MLRQLSFTPKYRRKKINEINIKNISTNRKISIEKNDYINNSNLYQKINPESNSKRKINYPDNKTLKRSQSSKTYISSNLSTGISSPKIQNSKNELSNITSINSNDDIKLLSINSNNFQSYKIYKNDNKDKRNNSFVLNNLNKTSLKKKFVNQFLKCICYDNLNQRITEREINEAKDDLDTNLSILSNWIDDINNKGFRRNESLIFDKKKKISKISEKLNYINSELSRSKRNIDKAYVINGKILNENIEIKKIYKSISSEKNKYTNEINKIKKEIEKIPEKIKNLKRETILIGGESISLNNQIKYSELEIQKLNNLISEKLKEIEKIGTMKNIIDNGIKSTKFKINDKMRNSSNFMIDVSDLVTNNNLFDSK
jgi:hypothetical protein